MGFLIISGGMEVPVNIWNQFIYVNITDQEVAEQWLFFKMLKLYGYGTMI